MQTLLQTNRYSWRKDPDFWLPIFFLILYAALYIFADMRVFEALSISSLLLPSLFCLVWALLRLVLGGVDGSAFVGFMGGLILTGLLFFPLINWEINRHQADQVAGQNGMLLKNEAAQEDGGTYVLPETMSMGE